MYKHILIPTDGSELADKAVEQGITLAKKIGAKITVLTVSVPFHILTTDPQMIEDTAPQYKRRMEEHAAKILKPVADAANAAGVPCTTAHLEHEHPYRAIMRPSMLKVAISSRWRRMGVMVFRQSRSEVRPSKYSRTRISRC